LRLWTVPIRMQPFLQLDPFLRRESLYCGFDFGNRAHKGRINFIVGGVNSATDDIFAAGITRHAHQSSGTAFTPLQLSH